MPAGLTALLYMCQSLTIDHSLPTPTPLTYSDHVLKLPTVIIRHSECLLSNKKSCPYCNACCQKDCYKPPKKLLLPFIINTILHGTE